MAEIFVASTMLGALGLGVLMLASLAWFQRSGDRRLAAEVSAVFSFPTG